MKPSKTKDRSDYRKGYAAGWMAGRKSVSSEESSAPLTDSQKALLHAFFDDRSVTVEARQKMVEAALDAKRDLFLAFAATLEITDDAKQTIAAAVNDYNAIAFGKIMGSLQLPPRLIH